MDIYQEQQFGTLIQTATDRYVARLEERFRGAEGALKHIGENAGGEDALLNGFTEAVFRDFLIDNVAGACFVLQALATRSMESVNLGMASATVETTLIAMAKQLFSELLLRKTIESLEQHSSYQAH